MPRMEQEPQYANNLFENWVGIVCQDCDLAISVPVQVLLQGGPVPLITVLPDQTRLAEHHATYHAKAAA